MAEAFEDVMMTLFVVADFIWLVQIWKSNKHFSREEKIRAISFTAAFLLAFFPFAMGHNILGAVISLIGYAVSEFTIAVTFYENYKDKEIAYE